MSLRNNLKSEKVKERYDRNQNSVETTFTQKELEEHDNQIREKAIDDFVGKLNDFFVQRRHIVLSKRHQKNR